MLTRPVIVALSGFLMSAVVTHAQTLEILHRFGQNSPPERPRAALLEATDGFLYGTSLEGGPSNHGTLFRMSRAGQVMVLRRFVYASEGWRPDTPLIQASDGSIYGTTRSGGPLQSFRGGGTVFRLDPDGSFHVVHAFGAAGDVAGPGALMQGSDGNFYGIADNYTNASGIGSKGAVYRMTPAGVVTVLHVFAGGAADGDAPTSLIQGTDGFFYGTTRFGGPPSTGVPLQGPGLVFRMTSAGAVTVLHTFGPAPAPATPAGGLIQGRDGHLYGTTEIGGSSNRGTVFRLTTSGVLTVLHSFTGVTGEGAGPEATLVQTTDGTLYGSTAAGGLESTVFRLATDGAVTVVTAPELCTGTGPRVSRTADDTIVIATAYCGSAGLGSILTLSGASSITTVHTFLPSHEEHTGSTPVVQRADGTLFGASCSGGRFGSGTAYKLAPSGTLTTLHAFYRPTDGACPEGLSFGRDGYLYGTTRNGGTFDSGTAFRLSPDGVLSVLHNFVVAEGTLRRGLLLATDGHFYGAAATGGASDLGTLFRMTTAGNVTVLHAFTGGSGSDRDGRSPFDPISQASDGYIYGSAGDTVFRVSLDGTYQILRRGLSLATALVEGIDGALYGVALEYSGTPNSLVACGKLIRLSTSGADTTLAALECAFVRAFGVTYDLTVLPDGSFAAIVERTGAAVVHESRLERLMPNGTRQAVYTFDTAIGESAGPLLLGSDGYLYGSFRGGGIAHGGRGGYLFRIRMTPPPPVRLSRGDFDGDRKSDVALYRPSTGYWYLRNSSTGFRVGAGNWIFQWGAAGDVPQPGDYDGDGLTDIAVYRPTTGQWFIRYSSLRYAVSRYGYFEWGSLGDTPLSADFDGDGRTDIGVYRPTSGDWFLRLSSHNFAAGAGPWIFQWGGAPGDIPKLGDFDADGKTDIVVYRAGEWFIRYSSRGYDPAQLGYYAWGAEDDATFLADFDGDRRSDLVVYRAGDWYLRLSTRAYEVGAGDWHFHWGSPGDEPKLLDVDGDGRTDITVYRPSTGQWFIRYSSQAYHEINFGYIEWGATGDVTLPEH